jgi:hypothetical protein
MVVVAPPPLLQLVLQQVTPGAGAVILGIAESEGLFVSSSHLASSLGLRDRHALRRLLREEGLPCYSQLAGWIRILIWLSRWEEDRLSLCRQASVTGHEPRSYYKTVQTVTGCTWREIQARGSVWTALALLDQCRGNTGSREAAISLAS